jgi:hypothetical protein
MHKICFTVSLFHASTCFEHHVLIVRRPKLYYTASGVITPIGGRPVHSRLSTCAPDGHLQIEITADAVSLKKDLLMMSSWCSKHVQAYIKRIIKQEFVH